MASMPRRLTCAWPIVLPRYRQRCSRPCCWMCQRRVLWHREKIIALQKKFRAPLGCQSAERVTVARHQEHNLLRRLGQMEQRCIHCGLQQGELREVLQMRGELFDLLP